ncbi:TerD family protein [Viridibacillus arvi]|uniref:TerD family protein n=1 Tax=Viridibacillus arvi TaxID=263475 RepID=UPI0034CF5439
MAINLTKGQKIDLTKGNSGLSQIMVGLGWEPVAKKSKGFLGFGGGNTADFDCDASVLMLKGDLLASEQDVVSFRKLKSNCGSVRHSGDNLTGSGSGDDETIFVKLHEVPSHFNKLVFVVNIYNAALRRQDFGDIKNAFIRVVNPQTNEELLRYNLSEDYSGKTALITGEIYRKDNEWKFGAVGTGTKDKSLEEIYKRYK